MPLRLTALNIVVPVILAALAAAAFRVYTAPERIQRRLETARETCIKLKAHWTVDERGAAVCRSD